MNLKKSILTFYHDIEITDISRDIVNMVIEDKNDLTGDLIIADYEHLESIEVKGGSLQNIHSLTIRDNPLLKSISLKVYACFEVVKVEIASLIALLSFT